MRPKTCVTTKRLPCKWAKTADTMANRFLVEFSPRTFLPQHAMGQHLSGNKRGTRGTGNVSRRRPGTLVRRARETRIILQVAPVSTHSVWMLLLPKFSKQAGRSAPSASTKSHEPKSLSWPTEERNTFRAHRGEMELKRQCRQWPRAGFSGIDGKLQAVRGWARKRCSGPRKHNGTNHGLSTT